MPSDRIITKYELNALNQGITDLSKSQFTTADEEATTNTGYTRFDFLANQITVMNHELEDTFVSVNWKGMQLKYEFISTMDRDRYRKSKLYLTKVIDIPTISDNYKIFSRNILIFIDGLLTMSPKLMIKESHVFLLFDYNGLVKYPHSDKTETIDDIIRRNAKITVYFTPNYQVTTTDIGIRSNRSNNGLHMISDNPSNVYYDGISNMSYLMFISTVDNHMSYLLDSQNYNVSQQYISRSTFSSKSNLNIIKIGLPYCVANGLTVSGTEKYIEIPKYHAPIDVNNIIIFEEDTDGQYIFSHDIKMKRHYINILEVVNNTSNKNIKLFIFSNETTSADYNYSNRAWTYNYLCKDNTSLLKSYKENNVIKPIKNFKPYPKISPNIKDYNKFDGGHDKHGISYKKKVINDASVYDELSTILFYSNLVNIDNIKTIFTVADIPDIVERTFRDNACIRPDNIATTTFTDDHVLFISLCRTSSEFITRIYTVDGIALFDTIHRFYDGTFDYTFIPKSLLSKEDILIEIDTRAEVDTGYNTTFTTLDDQFILSPYLYKTECYVNNIFMYDYETKKLIDRSKYNIMIQNMDGEFVATESTETFKRVETVAIKIIDEELLNREMVIKLVNKSIRLTKIASHDGEVVIFEMPKSFNRLGLKNHFKVYINGRLVPNMALRIAEHDDAYMSIASVTVNIELYENDRVECFYDPIPTEVVYFRRSDLPLNHMINIRAYGHSMTIPLHYRWNDLYINGRKLNHTTSDILTAARFYYTDKIKSAKNCEIRIRLADIVDGFSIKKTQTNIDEEIVQILEENGTISTNFPEVEDTEIDVIERLVESEAMEFIEFSDVYLRRKFIKPFLNQVDVFVQERFPRLLDPVTKDIYIEQERRFQPVPSYYGFINPNLGSTQRVSMDDYEL